MQVEICGTLQVVPDDLDLSNKPWVKTLDEKKEIRQGDKLWIDDTQYIVSLIPVDSNNFSKGWKAFAISLTTGTRYDEGHIVSNQDWRGFPIPFSWV